MEKRTTYFVSRKNVLTWLAALLMIGSAGLRIAYFCGKGADATTVWLQIVLPAAAGLIFALQILLDGKEHFYRTATPVFLMAVYFVVVVVATEMLKRYVFVNILVFLAFYIFYRQITSGRWSGPWLLTVLFAGAAAVYGYYHLDTLRQWQLHRMADTAMLLGCFVVSLAVRPHADGVYHPTWGDRSDGRLVRTLPGMSKIEPYIMTTRNTSCNTIHDELEITNIEKYVREKRKEGLTHFGINHVFIAAYVRCVSQYPAVNRFVSGQKVYSRGDEIQYCMTIKREMTTESPDTCIKLHLKPTDTVYEVYEKMEAAVREVKDAEDLDNGFESLVSALASLPGLFLAFVVVVLRTLDYFGLLPGFLLELSPFHGSVFFTSMGSLGIPAIIHHLYDFGNLPVFIAFGCKYRRNEVANDGTVEHKKYVDMGFTLDERICDGFYYAAVLKYLRRLLAHPERLDTPPETVVKDIP
ncbi:MAG: hypothetical protein J6J43_01375 [Oscillospiraceae bacterium]|nr:hypothetical protein [Oscillospiraceae bacterium]